MKYCCRAFDHCFQLVDEEGWSIYSLELRGQPVFYMAYNAMSFQDFDNLEVRLARRRENQEQRSIKEQEHVDYGLGGTIPVKYCPWCGRFLSKFYRKTWRELMAPTETGFEAWRSNASQEPNVEK